MVEKKKVFVNGYGSIGRRIASFLKEDPEVVLLGVGKYSPDEKVNVANSLGIDVYVPQSKRDSFSDYKIAGTIEDALDNSDLVIDASPGKGSGAENKQKYYEPRNLKVIYQGGESTADSPVSNILFNSKVNYKAASGKQHVIQGSCNVTGMGRVIESLKEKYGDQISRFDLTLIRRWADLEQTEKKISDTIEISTDPHHGKDAESFLKNITLFVRAIKVPTRQMHLHILDVRFKQSAPEPSEIHDLLKNEFGVSILENAKSTKEIRDYANDAEFKFGDTNMIHIHANMTKSRGDTLQIMYSDDQTGIVIPENHILMQAMLSDKKPEDVFAHTESVFKLKERKKKLEERFAKKD